MNGKTFRERVSSNVVIYIKKARYVVAKFLASKVMSGPGGNLCNISKAKLF
jgi:hypothetical protein